MDNREVLLEVKNVSKIYGDLHALKEVYPVKKAMEIEPALVLKGE